MNPTEKFGVVANHYGDKAIREGTKCWICHSSNLDHVWFRAVSRSGRWVCRAVATWKLSNFRVKPRVTALSDVRLDVWLWEDRKEAEQWAQNWDKAAREERARRNACEIERMAGLMDEHGRRTL